MKATTKNQVIDILQWTSEKYEDELFTSMWNWCARHGGYPSVIQQLMANASINRWFICEFSKCENQFLKIAAVVPSNNTKQLETHYKTCTEEIQKKFNLPLIESVKRNKDFSNIFVTNTPVYYAN